MTLMAIASETSKPMIATKRASISPHLFILVVQAVLTRLLFNHHLFVVLLFFFFNDTATTEIYTLSLHDALPISPVSWNSSRNVTNSPERFENRSGEFVTRSEEHTSELQSRPHLVCRLLLEKKNIKQRHRPEGNRRLDDVDGDCERDQQAHDRDKASLDLTALIHPSSTGGAHSTALQSSLIRSPSFFFF